MARLRDGRFRRAGGPTERATSCGGIIVRQSDSGLELVLGKRNHEGARATWSLPKGTPDDDESAEQTALREVAEETGLDISEADLVGPLASRVVVHGYSDVVTTQDEQFWFVRCAPFEVSTDGHTEVELATMTAHRWWSRAELEQTSEDIWPRNLLTIWDQVGAGDEITAAPLALGEVDESTVAPG